MVVTSVQEADLVFLGSIPRALNGRLKNLEPSKMLAVLESCMEIL